MNKAIITISRDGTARCLYTELIALEEIGEVTITRATDIEFNHKTRHWNVRTPDGVLLFEHRSRIKCLQWEQAHQEEIVERATISSHRDADALPKS